MTVGTLLAACHHLGTQLKDHRIVFLGAGSAGCGIAEQIVAKMCSMGVSETEARRNIYLLNSQGLVTDNSPELQGYQRNLAQKSATLDWLPQNGIPQLLDVIENVKPTVLIGVSGQPNKFNETIVKAMFTHCPRPIIMPLSNPTSKAEGIPAEIIEWADGQAIVATGSPFAPIEYRGRRYPISQCNNSYIFPGVGLGVIAAEATRVTDNMMMASSEALARCSPLITGTGDSLLPSLTDIREVSKKIAKAVALQAMDDNVAFLISEEALEEKIEKNFWEPVYRNYRRTSF